MKDNSPRADDRDMILGVARAMREELGSEIEDQPGGPDPAGAGQANRALRAAARYLLGSTCPPGPDPAAWLSWALKRAARRRLAEGSLGDREIESLLGRAEGGGRNDWFAFLLLTPWDEVEHLLGEAEP